MNCTQKTTIKAMKHKRPKVPTIENSLGGGEGVLRSMRRLGGRVPLRKSTKVLFVVLTVNVEGRLMEKLLGIFFWAVRAIS